MNNRSSAFEVCKARSKPDGAILPQQLQRIKGTSNVVHREKKKQGTTKNATHHIAKTWYNSFPVLNTSAVHCRRTRMPRII
jgi:hypothetical protein